LCKATSSSVTASVSSTLPVLYCIPCVVIPKVSNRQNTAVKVSLEIRWVRLLSSCGMLRF
jgi:hypothetical protein